MKAIYLDSPNNIAVADVPEAQRKDGEVLIKVKALGICGSDVSAYKGTSPLVSYPRIIGHEAGGEVVEIGENSKGIKPGDKVVLEPYKFCGKCYPCSIGRTNCCEDMKVLGVHVDGAMTEYFAHPIELTHKVPDDMEWKDVAMIEPLCIALQSNHRSAVKAGEHVVVSGAGPIGLLSAQVALVYGAIPIVIDLIEERLEIARSLGITYTINPMKESVVDRIREITNGRMAEVIIEASGAKSAIQGALDYVSYAGRIALTGWPVAEIPLNTTLITKKELDVRGSRNSVGNFPEAIELIYSKKIIVDPIITKIVALEELAGAVVDIAKHPDQFMKVVSVL